MMVSKLMTVMTVIIASGSAEVSRDLPDIWLDTQDIETAEAVARQYDNQIIYIKPTVKNSQGYWLDTLVSEKYKNMAQFTKVLEDDVIEQPNLKWRVDKVGDRGQVTLQSVQLNEYLCRDSEPSHFFLALELSSYPQDNERMIFYIADVGNGLYHFTNLYKDLIPLSFEFFISESSSDIKGKFSFGNPENYMIYIPPKSDSLYAIASFENPGASGITFEYETVIGIVNTMPGAKKISASVEVSIGLEIRGAFSYGMKYSQTWNTSSCEIYSKATTTVVTITVPPHKVAWVMQVVGTYGHYSVYSNDIKVVNKNPSGVLRMEEFNRGELLPESYIIDSEQKVLVPQLLVPDEET